MTVRDAVRTEIERYVDRNPLSAARHERAAKSMPGGNTRSILHFEPFPLAFERGEDAHLWSLDGDRYADFLGEFTAGLYGHSQQAILDAVRDALDRGLNFGGVNELEPRLAELICARFPSVDLVRFTNSGTEANLMALALAVAVTGRRKILVFRGGYHGGVLTFGETPSPVTVPHEWVLADYDDVDGTRALIRAHGRDLAAVLVEPMLGAGGCVPASQKFLEMLRAETTATGALLIFDEVMTSRLAPGGLQSRRGRDAGPHHAGQVPRRRPLLRRLRRPRGPDGGLRPDPAGRAVPRRHLQQQRAHHERRHRRPRARPRRRHPHRRQRPR